MKSTKPKVHEVKLAGTGAAQGTLVIVITIVALIALVMSYIPFTQPHDVFDVLVAIALLLLARIIQAGR